MRHSGTAKRQIHHVDSCAHRAQGWTAKEDLLIKVLHYGADQKQKSLNWSREGELPLSGLKTRCDACSLRSTRFAEMPIFPLTAIM